MRPTEGSPKRDVLISAVAATGRPTGVVTLRSEPHRGSCANLTLRSDRGVGRVCA
jgi:hypothetical protein